jgi:pyruvate kinase
VNREILCTLGPSSLDRGVIHRLEELGVSLFRLNLSHTEVRDAARCIRFVQSATTVPLSLDTEGAQVRTGSFVDGPIEVRENRVIRACRSRVPGDSHEFNLYPYQIIEQLQLGDFLHIDANVLAQVVDFEEGAVALRVLSGGRISQNKAVTVERDIAMPPLTEKDLRILAIGRELGIRHVALSFANRASDVDAIRAAAGPDVSVISKIECRAGLANLVEIAECYEALLIDRGDLSRQVPLEQLPALQKRIIRAAREAGRKVYVATNLMESMTTSPIPTRAEVNDVYNTLVDGADGLVLAAETAIGQYPIGCAGMVARIIREFENEDEPAPSPDPISQLVEPHGGRLVHRELPPSEAGLRGAPMLEVDDAVLADCEQIATGVLSPLTGFLGREALESVLADHRLPDGTLWSLPVLLPLDRETASGLGAGARVLLVGRSGRGRALLEVEEVYAFERRSLARRWFGTHARERRGAARVPGAGDRFVSGGVTLIEPFTSANQPFVVSAHRRFVLSPIQIRSVFAKKGWSRVVGFATRNVPHRVHQFIQLSALDSTHADGLFIAGLVSPPHRDAFLPDLVLRGYQTLLDFGRYPSGRVVLGALAGNRQFPGSREAVHAAICFKNMGCSHVVFGPGPAEGREPTDAIPDLFGRLGDFGVTPVFFDEIGYDREREEYRKLGQDVQRVRSSDIRDALRRDEELPDWMLADVVQEMLDAERRAGRSLFCGARAAP